MSVRWNRGQPFVSAGSVLLALAVPSLLPAQQEALDRAPRESIVLTSGAVVYPQGIDPDLAPESGFGPDQHVVNIPFSQFSARGTGTYNGICCSGDGARWPNSGSNVLVAAIDAGLVPNGADLQQVAFYFQDSNSAVNSNFAFYVCRTWVHADGSGPDGDCPVSAFSSGSPDDTVLTVDPNLAVLYRDDVDGDGGKDEVSYLVVAWFGVNGEQVYDGSLRLRQVRLLYQRQVSPAPVVASFGDVPTNHGFFQFIEALADSDITAGCGSGNFCPDAPVTRGQMAVFLAKALGLHWPAF